MVPLYPFPQILQHRTLVSSDIRTRQMSAKVSIPLLCFPESEHVLDISVASPTVYARDGSIISVSSDSDQTTSAVGELGYPPDVTDEGPVVMDLLSPVRLFVWVKVCLSCLSHTK